MSWIPPRPNYAIDDDSDDRESMCRFDERIIELERSTTALISSWGTTATMLSNVVAEFSHQDLRNINTPDVASITDTQHLSSYNWIEALKSTPTIAVPGSPNLWSPPSTPLQLRKDSGHFYIAQNAARHPEYPLEPLFCALFMAHPSFDINTVDVVTDRNNIRKLLVFVNPSLSAYAKEDFTINIEVVNNTAIFCRDETKAVEYIAPNEFRGFGHTFEKKYTTTQVKGSTGHHRIVSYNFGGLKFLLRHETDGYVGAPGRRLQPSNKPNSDVNDLSKVLGSLDLDPKYSPENGNGVTNPTNSKLRIQKEGKVVPIDATLEIKTRVAHRPLDVKDIAPQLWISQTPKLVRAYHKNGLFGVPKVEDMATRIKIWEHQNEIDLKVLAGLIRKIRDVVKENGDSAVLKYEAKENKLSLQKREGRKMLPTDLYAKWIADERKKSAVSDQTKSILFKTGSNISDKGADVVPETKGGLPDKKSSANPEKKSGIMRGRKSSIQTVREMEDK